MGLEIDPDVGVPVIAWSLTTALGVILFAALLRGPARRGWVPVRADPAGASVAVSAAVSTVSRPSAPAASAPGPATGQADAKGEEMNAHEATLPPWLRPTLRKQRQPGDRGILSGARAAARFDSSPPPGVERRTIAYRLVRVSDEPDDLQSNEVGRLDRGDEVEVIGEREGFVQVRTPSGLEGWVSRVVIVG